MRMGLRKQSDFESWTPPLLARVAGNAPHLNGLLGPSWASPVVELCSGGGLYGCQHLGPLVAWRY